jgi:hypothetical protein
VLAICFKESGWLTFVIALAILAFESRLRTIPVRVYALAGCLALALLYARFVSLPGSHSLSLHPAGVSPMTLLWTYCAGFYGNLPRSAPFPWLIGNALFLGLWLRQKKGAIVGWVAFCSLFAAILFIQAMAEHVPYIVAVAAYTDPTLLKQNAPQIAEVACWLYAVSLLFRNKHLFKMASLFVVCAVIAAVPCALIGVRCGYHALTITYQFQSVFLAMAVAACTDHLFLL